MNEIMHACTLCRRACGIDRTIRAGRCGGTDEVLAARAALHMWEEPCISGTEGSGTVFFAGCPLGCVFCQNREIALGTNRFSGNAAGRGGQREYAQGGDISGRSPAAKSSQTADRGGSGASPAEATGAHEPPVLVRLTEGELAEVFLNLQAHGANNINLVTPTHFVPQIIEAVRRARADGLRLPIVYNTGSYETAETIRLLMETVDIWLPDLKFFDPETAERYAKAPDYFETAIRAIDEMVSLDEALRGGDPVFDERGLMRHGVIVRHMILPGHTKDSKWILKYLHETYGDRIMISIMNQYTPMPGIGERYPELDRRVTKREYERVLDYALELGITRAYVQEGPTARSSFIPSFRGEGLEAWKTR